MTRAGIDTGDTVVTTNPGTSIAGAVGRLQLVIVGAGTIIRHPLPEAGDVSVGRSAQCDVSVDEPSVSRRHAVIHVGPPLTIEDLDSANGTRARGAPVVPGRAVPLEVGEAAELGALLLTVQQVKAAAPPRRVWTHGHFEVRLEEEVTRAGLHAGTLAVARVHCDRGAPPRLVQEALASLLAPTDVVGCYGPLEYEVILLDAREADAEATARRLTAGLAARGLAGRVGIACYPRDGRDPYSLAERACAGARGEAVTAAPPGVIVADPAMRQLYRLVERVAAGTISVLILGETGVGKEVVAEAVHRLSPRARAPFLRLSCAALSETLLESELFGHERGAFTGAVQAKPGLLETAQGGTVFLDEVGELPLPTQVKLLRVLEERQVLRVGALKPRPIDVRFISATNRDLEAEVARGACRQDLFFRLNGFALLVPPLRDRVSEIAPLVGAFAARAARDSGLPTPVVVSPEAQGCLERYCWPGNIRELRNVVERAVLLADGEVIRPEHLPLEKMGAMLVTPASPHPDDRPPRVAVAPAPRGAAPGSAPPPPTGPFPGVDPRLAADPEYCRIMDALARCAGNQTQAAHLLGIARRNLVYRLDKYGIARPRQDRRRR
ncbi:MAG: sigma 54-interacting transcriptional regulator [Gammaproteobacteria bacterium]|nr:sigma 54-interacting transcriptional regulator [Gammaproteobacteria bacterium]